MEPGLFLAAILSSGGFGWSVWLRRVVVLRAHQKMVNHHQAWAHQAMAAIEDHCAELFDGDLEVASVAASAEIRWALNLTRRAADTELNLAHTLRQRLPLLWDALVSGIIDVRRAKNHRRWHRPPTRRNCQGRGQPDHRSVRRVDHRTDRRTIAQAVH